MTEQSKITQIVAVTDTHAKLQYLSDNYEVLSEIDVYSTALFPVCDIDVYVQLLNTQNNSIYQMKDKVYVQFFTNKLYKHYRLTPYDMELPCNKINNEENNLFSDIYHKMTTMIEPCPEHYNEAAKNLHKIQTSNEYKSKWLKTYARNMINYECAIPQIQLFIDSFLKQSPDFICGFTRVPSFEQLNLI